MILSPSKDNTLFGSDLMQLFNDSNEKIYNNKNKKGLEMIKENNNEVLIN